MSSSRASSLDHGHRFDFREPAAQACTAKLGKDDQEGTPVSLKSSSTKRTMKQKVMRRRRGRHYETSSVQSSVVLHLILYCHCHPDGDINRNDCSCFSSCTILPGCRRLLAHRATQRVAFWHSVYCLSSSAKVRHFMQSGLLKCLPHLLLATCRGFRCEEWRLL